MKRVLNKSYYIIGLGMLLLTQSCSDFLNRKPIDNFTSDEYWTSEANVRTYAWRLYNEFLGYGNGTGTTSEFYFQHAPSNGCMNISDDINSNIFLTFPTTSATTSSEWTSYYATIRGINFMLASIPTVPMAEANAKHWEGVARFFRAYTYFRLVQRYGDVPYIDKYVSANDYENIYVKRTPRNEVMDKVLADLQIAANQMFAVDAGATTVNKYTALALMARVGLYEGTIRKYQSMGDGSAFLQAAKDAAAQVMANPSYTLAVDYKSVYASVELSANTEVILYKRYLPSVLTHTLQSYTQTSTVVNGLNKSAVESYACVDGLPIGQSPLYQGDAGIKSVIRNRDKRLMAAVDTNGYGYADKTLYGVLSSSTGYLTALFNSFDPSKRPLSTDVTTGGQNQVDAPVFGLAEVMLNYAEACAELGTCTQADLDKSLNLLRKRAGLPNLVMAGANVTVNGVTINDPKRVSALEQISGEVSPLIWEIRRDRRAELMAWTYIRYYDLMRWHKGEYLDFTKNPDVALGANLKGATLSKTKVNADGYMLSYATTASRTFDPAKHYLNSVPLNDITLYAAEGIELTQNPGWNK